MSHHQAVEDERERLEIIREIRRLREEMDTKLFWELNIRDGLLDRAKWAEWRKEHGYKGPVSKMDVLELTAMRDDLEVSIAKLMDYCHPREREEVEVCNATTH